LSEGKKDTTSKDNLFGVSGQLLKAKGLQEARKQIAEETNRLPKERARLTLEGDLMQASWNCSEEEQLSLAKSARVACALG